MPDQRFSFASASAQLFHQSRGTGVASSSMSSIAVPVLSPEGVASDVTPEGVEQEYKVHSCSRALKRSVVAIPVPTTSLPGISVWRLTLFCILFWWPALCVLLRAPTHPGS